MNRSEMFGQLSYVEVVAVTRAQHTQRWVLISGLKRLQTANDDLRDLIAMIFKQVL